MIPPPYEYPKDALPPYSPALESFGLVLVKRELASPYQQHSRTEWQPCFMELNSTQLNFYQIEAKKRKEAGPSVSDITQAFNAAAGITDRASASAAGRQWPKAKSMIPSVTVEGLFSHPVGTCLSNMPAPLASRSLAKLYLTSTRLPTASYTMQRAHFGVAPDFTANKKPICLRARIESEQLLIQFLLERALTAWYFKLVFARDVSLPVEMRQEPKGRTLPQTRRSAFPLGDGESEGEGYPELDPPVREESHIHNSSRRASKFDSGCVTEFRSRLDSTCSTQSSGSTLNSQFSLAFMEDDSDSSVFPVDEAYEATATHTIGLTREPNESGASFADNGEASARNREYVRKLMGTLKATDRWVGQPVVVSHNRLQTRINLLMTTATVSGASKGKTMRVLGGEAAEGTPKEGSTPDALLVSALCGEDTNVRVLLSKDTTRFSQSNWKSRPLGAHVSQFVVTSHGFVC